MLTHLSRNVRQNLVLVLQFYLKHRVGKVLDDRGHHFNRIFFRQIWLVSLTDGKSDDRDQVCRNLFNRSHPIDLMIDAAFPIVGH